MRPIAERLVLDLVAFAKAPAQQMRGVLAALVGAPRGDDVNCSSSLCHARISAVICELCQFILVTTNCISANYNFSYAQAHNLRFKTPNQGETSAYSQRASSVPARCGIFRPVRAHARGTGGRQAGPDYGPHWRAALEGGAWRHAAVSAVRQ